MGQILWGKAVGAAVVWAVLASPAALAAPKSMGSGGQEVSPAELSP